ncbi:unnamed protein product [Paramecium octaurelia]|uniref:Uncharacterized protein n=1 Tax=Paramecium octaurelia TaxID=43137 RepID=A0A8S1U9C7_PAROT|nr:unnamed protein product [Paramecium octaurelia]
MHSQASLCRALSILKNNLNQLNFQNFLISLFWINQILTPIDSLKCSKDLIKRKKIENPYRLSWANLILHKHYSIEIVESGYRIRIKKLQATEGTSILNINISFTSRIGIKIKREKAISYQCYSLFQKQFRKILQTKKKISYVYINRKLQFQQAKFIKQINRRE